MSFYSFEDYLTTFWDHGVPQGEVLGPRIFLRTFKYTFNDEMGGESHCYSVNL